MIQTRLHTLRMVGTIPPTKYKILVWGQLVHLTRLLFEWLIKKLERENLHQKARITLKGWTPNILMFNLNIAISFIKTTFCYFGKFWYMDSEELSHTYIIAIFITPSRTSNFSFSLKFCIMQLASYTLMCITQ